MSAYDSTLLPPNHQPLPTKKNGDCAFHAIFGTWNGRQFECRSVRAMKKQMAQQMQSPKAGEQIYTCAEEGSWLSPAEIELIANVFNISIDCYIKDSHKQLHCTKNYNPGQSQKVSVYFNGTNRYKKIEDPNNFPEADPEATLTTTASSLSENQLKEIEEAKIDDLNILFKLHQTIELFLQPPIDQITQSKVRHFLMRIAQACTEIKWNNKSSQHIRNLYGKMCYPKNQANTTYLDFERLSLIYRFQDPTTLDQISHIIFHAIDAFLPEMRCLSNNIIFILNQELRTHRPLSTACQDIVQQLDLSNFTQKILHPLPLFTALIDVRYDALFIQRLCLPEIRNAFDGIDPEIDSLKWRYTFGRILTIIGEAAKNFSTAFKERNCHLPLDTLGKLRDQIGHAHHRHIIKANPETFALYKTIASTELNNFQEELARILQTLPGLLGKDTQEVCSILKTYEQMPPILGDVQESLKLTDLTSEEAHFLVPARIRWLKQREIQLHRKTNHIQQITASSTIPTHLSDRDIRNKRRYKEKRQQLLNRTDLNPNEKMTLESIQHELARIKRRQKAYAKTGPSSSMKTKELQSSEEIEQELQAIQQELQALRMLPLFDQLLTLFKQGPKGRKNTPTQRLYYQMTNLATECQRLKEMTFPENNARNFAKEHCLSTIGQLMRELEDNKNLILEQVIQENATVREAFASNIKARNQNIMHDPFTDHTSHLNCIIENETLPLLPDLKALQIIWNENNSKNHNGVFSSMLKTYCDLAFAYARLNLFEQAEEYFLRALAHTSKESYSNFHSRDTLATTSSEPPPLSQIASTSATDPSTAPLEDEAWIPYRAQVLTNLGCCQIWQGKEKEAFVHLHEALNIYRSFPNRNSMDGDEIRTCYFISLLENNEEAAMTSLPEIRELAKTNHNHYANVLLAFAIKIGSKENYEEALKLIKEIDIEKITHPLLFLRVYFIQSSLFGLLATKIEKQSTGPDEDATFQRSLQMREKAITTLDSVRQKIKENLGPLKELSGNSVKDFLQRATRHLCGLLYIQAEKLIYCENTKTQGLKLLERASKLETKYHFEI